MPALATHLSVVELQVQLGGWIETLLASFMEHAPSCEICHKGRENRKTETNTKQKLKVSMHQGRYRRSKMTKHTRVRPHFPTQGK